MKETKHTIARSPHVAWQEVSDKVVVVTPRTRKIHILYGSGASIWKYLEKPKSPTEITDLLCKEYDVAFAEAKKDTEEFIEQLKIRQVVSLQ
jgi:hypothetical protein